MIQFEIGFHVKVNPDWKRVLQLSRWPTSAIFISLFCHKIPARMILSEFFTQSQKPEHSFGGKDSTW